MPMDSYQRRSKSRSFGASVKAAAMIWADLGALIGSASSRIRTERGADEL
jgi:hypothetical protein